MKCSTDFQECNQGFVCKQCVNMHFCCSDVVCLTDLRPPWICCFYRRGLAKSFPKTPWQQQIPHSVFCLNEQFLHHLFQWNCTKTNHQFILPLYKGISKSLKKSPIIFKEETFLLFNCFVKLRPCSAIGLKEFLCVDLISMLWYKTEES